VEFSTALLWKCTIRQKSERFNSTAVGIYNNLEEWKLHQHCCGNLQHPRRVEFSTAPLWKSALPQKSERFNSTAVGIYNIPEEWKLHQHCCGNLESRKHFSLSNIRYRNLKRGNSEKLKKGTWNGTSRLVVAKLFIKM
jgi:muramidase (phage lysozyme)